MARSRAFLISFWATLLGFIALTAGLSLLPQAPIVYHLPEQLPRYEAAWSDYVPASSLQFTFYNFTALRSINSSVPPNNELLPLLEPAFTLNSSEVYYHITVTTELPNATANIEFITPSAYLRLVEALKAASGQEYRGFLLYQVRVKEGSASSLGWLGLPKEHEVILFAAGRSEALQLLQLIIRTFLGEEPRLVDSADTRALLYVSGGISHLALGILNFAGPVNGSQRQLISIDETDGRVAIKNVLGFSDTGAAVRALNGVRRAFLGASEFNIYDQYVLAIEYRPLAQLEASVRLVGG